ncbi:MAG: GNAT family N-acetyltransferase [Psychrosphaera sp.]|nr:GNAT family N-acetyltransferase [Psychrosphaera sp.]
MSHAFTFVELDKSHHDRASFDCGEALLNTFIQTQAAKHMSSGISRTMVLPMATKLANNKHGICAFYSIAPSAIRQDRLPPALAKKLPGYPVPVFLIAQLGVHSDHHGCGLGKVTLLSALETLWKINEKMRAYAVIVDCLTPAAESFYAKFGFEKLVVDSRLTRMFITMKTIKALFG